MSLSYVNLEMLFSRLDFSMRAASHARVHSFGILGEGGTVAGAEEEIMALIHSVLLYGARVWGPES